MKSETTYFASSAAARWTERNIGLRVVFDSALFRASCENVTSSANSEVHDIAFWSERIGATATGNMHRKFDEIRTCGFELLERTGRQTDTQTDWW